MPSRTWTKSRRATPPRQACAAWARRTLAAAAFACVTAISAFAAADSGDETVVTLADGRTLSGPLLAESDDAVHLEIAGIRTSIPRADIRAVATRPGAEAAFHARRAELDDNDIEGRLQLARATYDRGAHAVAQAELQSLAALVPENERVRMLLAAVNARLSPGGERGSRLAAPAQPEAVALLNDEQVNLIKVWELPKRLSDARVLVHVPRQTMMDVFNEFRRDPMVPKGKVAQRDFFRRSGLEQVEFLFKLAAYNPDVRRYYSQIHINGDPPAIEEFRRLLHRTYVQHYFHRFFGDGKVPGIDLRVGSRDLQREMYTNLYLLSTMRIDGRPLINRRAPEESLLLQWGLPREAAIHPAPAIRHWRPFFGGTDDPKFKRFVAWIKSLYPNARGYGIDFEGSATGLDPGGSEEPGVPSSDDFNS